MIRHALNLFKAAKLVVALFLIVLIETAPAAAQSAGEVPGGASGSVGNAEIWRQIRQGASGRVTIPDPNAAIMIRTGSEQWRKVRSEWLPKYGAIPIAVVVGLLAVFYLVRGRIRIEGGRSGRDIPRFRLSQRTMHWLIACLFILLAVSGLFLLFGRSVLIPLIGKQAFSVIASASLQGHNLFGPIFVVVFVPMVLMFLKGNGFNLVDLKWLLKGGGLFGGHASSEKNNFGEKAWYWMLVLGGAVLCVSGLLLLFPLLAEKIEYLSIAQVAHGAAAVLLISVAIGHIYIGSLGMEGAIEGMTKGTVDENWALQHHDLWAEKVITGQAGDDAEAPSEDAIPAPAE